MSAISEKLFVVVLMVLAFITMSGCGSGYVAADDITRLPYRDNGDGTITQVVSGLQWMRDANPAGKTLALNDAQQYIAEVVNKSLRPGGYNDWRLPSQDEMTALAGDGLTVEPHVRLKACGFVNVQPGWYWTSSLLEPGEPYVVIISMVNAFPGDCNKTDKNYLWLVRQGL